MSSYLVKISMLVMSLAASTFAQASQPYKQTSIWVGMDLQLGMPRDQVITKLTADYSVTKLQLDGDEWAVADKNDPTIWEGHLGFRDGKLTYADRSWTGGTEDKYSFAQALWGAMSQMESEGLNSCTFDVPTTRSPVAEIRYVRFYCGAKKIEITIIDVFTGEAEGPSVSISEVLSSEKNR
jgi:hypothetical protein